MSTPYSRRRRIVRLIDRIDTELSKGDCPFLEDARRSLVDAYYETGATQPPTVMLEQLHEYSRHRKHDFTYVRIPKRDHHARLAHR